MLARAAAAMVAETGVGSRRFFSSMPEARPFIGGEYHIDQSAEKLDVCEPASGRHLSTWVLKRLKAE